MGQLWSSIRFPYHSEILMTALVEILVLHTENVEKVFRSVDRGFYFNGEKENKYKDPLYDEDTTFKYYTIILSSSSICAIALETLDLQKGQKFLNIGSGTGYFNTLAGLLLGVNGVNHGLEINQYLINLAYQNLEEFKLNAAAIDHFQFCEPVFIRGYAWELLKLGYYDKVYCEDFVPDEKVNFMKSLIKIGGILVMPVDFHLVKIERLDDILYKTTPLVEAMSFDPLSISERERFITETATHNIVEFPSVQPLDLKEVCRLKIRSVLRDNLLETSPNLSILPPMCTSNYFFSKLMSQKKTPINTLFNKIVFLDSKLGKNSTSLSVKNYHDGSIQEYEVFYDNQTESLAAANSRYRNYFKKKINKNKQRDSDAYKIIESKVKNKYNVIFEHNKNEFSQLLKAKIDSLQLPGSVKQFLNYNRTD